MLYFAELSGKPVTSSDGKRIGHLDDLIFLASGQPLITKLSIRSPAGPLIVPITSVNVFNGGIKLVKGFETVEVAENGTDYERP